MNAFNYQEIFDRVVNHFAVQGRPARLGPCKYRLKYHGQILSCAVGCLIDDANYDKSLEGDTVLSSRITAAVAKSLDCEISAHNQEFLYDLQAIHDAPANVDSLKKGLTQLAARYQLDPSQVDNITTWTTL